MKKKIFDILNKYNNKRPNTYGISQKDFSNIAEEIESLLATQNEKSVIIEGKTPEPDFDPKEFRIDKEENTDSPLT